MTSINPTGAFAANGTTASQSSTSGHAAPNPLASLTNPNTFLNLLVAQLKYQDPLNPTSGTQFLSQTAQLTQVETMTSLANKMASELAAQQTQTSTSMIGKQITAKLADGKTVTGQVQGVSLDPSNGPSLSVQGVSTPVPLSAVLTVGTVA